jgi:pSer/pThr/pTyr-binding forkhead associated (FHA) protein
MHDIFPQVDLTQVDLTQDLGREQGVSREHTCIFQQGNSVKVEDLGSTNGTLLNGERLDPYMAETLEDGDQFQMGELLIEVSFES